MYDTATVLGAPTAAPPPSLLSGASLFLDFDGTLVEIAERPDAVLVSARLKAVLRSLATRLAGRVAIVSGRSVAAIQGLLGNSRLTVVGSHGMEFRYADGRAATPPRPAELAVIEARMADVAREWPGVLVEAKALGAALHYRGCPPAERACIAVATELAERYGLALQTGKMMIEVRAGGGDKGTAIRQLMLEPEFQHTRPVFIGDDDTDEPGFRAAHYCGGAGILVGTPRPSAAHFNLPDAAAVVEWLERATRG